MHLPRIIFVRREKHRSTGLVHSLNSQYFEVALRQLTVQLSLRLHRILLLKTVEIKMHVAVAPTRPKELTPGLEKTNFHMLEVDPCSRRGFCQDNPRLARFR